ncbi:SdpI family protein [Neobacillus muris]|uniref:SdpI family protein n=1 Tax=Neobacillus muris TaxID=2941334 RepID=UPI0020425009|nr:SdpI family protein [Neobacillus muris]
MKKYGFGLFLLLLTVIGTVAAYPYMPDQVAEHWNYKGVPDRYSHKSFGLFSMPVFMILLYVLTMLLPKIDPKKNNYKRFEGTYFWTMNGILVILFLLQAVKITTGLGVVNPKYVVPELAGLLFIFIGNVSPKFKPNYFFGIRTPWTLANEEVWKKTHRLGGKVFVVSGLLLLIVPWLPAFIQAYYAISIILICLAIILFSSYYFFIKI